MADSKLFGRNDFLWGVMFHANGWGAPFKYENIEQSVLLAARMGCKMIRIDSTADYKWLDKAIKLCNAYGMKVMLIIYIPNFSVKSPNIDLAAVSEHFKTLASRYDGKQGFGKIDFIQLHNELDLPLLSASCDGKPAPNGDKPEDWNNDYLEIVLNQLKAAVKGVKASGNDAKTVINMTWKHYGMIRYFYDNGLEWDIIGHDWYSDMMSALVRSGETPYAIGNFLYETFGKEIILCETNMFGKLADFDENDPSNWDLFVDCMADCYSQSHVIGFSVYELLDELRFDAHCNGYDQESHFGLVYCDLDGNIGDVKPIYRRMQNIIGGNDELPTIDFEKLN